MRKFICTATMVGSLVLSTVPHAAAAQEHHADTTPTTAELIVAAVASPARNERLRAMDEGRRPAEVLAWSGIAPGMDVADLMPGLGYWSEMMADVVGTEGSVAALEPQEFYNEEPVTAHWAALMERSPQIVRLRYRFDLFSYPAESLDFALINNSYHDLYWESERYAIPHTDPNVFVAALYGAMRPGGQVVVIDHAGHGADVRALVDAMHRIDPATVRADFERAGFVLVDESDLLHNPADDHSLDVFDDAIAGHTDRFMLKFERPAGD
jgi:predicted methyltransferase